MAVLVDLDYSGPPPGRTPFGHSVPAAIFWCGLACALAAILAPAWLAGTALAAATAFATHLALDAFTAGGVFLWPRSCGEHAKPAPFGGRSFFLDGAEYALPPDGREGLPAVAAGAWPSWHAAPASRPKFDLEDRDARLNLAVTAAGLAGSLAVIILG